MVKRLYVFGSVVMVALALAAPSFAVTSVTAPTLDPGAYASGVISALSANLGALFLIGGIMAGIGGVIGLTRRFGRLGR